MGHPLISSINSNSARYAQARLDSLTKPVGSLGRLEELVVQLAGITGNPVPDMSRKAVVVMAADHGVAGTGVSAYPQDVTRQMVLNFLSGGAAINVLARHAGATVKVVDMGVCGQINDHPDLITKKIRQGTANMAEGSAMSIKEAETAINIGIDIANDLASKGFQMVATGDMGIGNTTPSSAIASVFTGLPAQKVTGRGTGVDDAGLAGKIKIIEKAIEVNKPDPTNALGVLAKVGGFEIAGLTGLIIGCASRRIAVMIDGFISGAAALIAWKLAPQTKDYMIASHMSTECGHLAILKLIGLKPLFDLNLRLGEGTGAVLAFGLVDASLKIMTQMATFESAHVSEKI
jgi:nicotinate-nucleotide--dimethylbenzimidazole phosphoribosyltransferase